MSVEDLIAEQERELMALKSTQPLAGSLIQNVDVQITKTLQLSANTTSTLTFNFVANPPVNPIILRENFQNNYDGVSGINTLNGIDSSGYFIARGSVNFNQSTNTLTVVYMVLAGASPKGACSIQLSFLSQFGGTAN